MKRPPPRLVVRTLVAASWILVAVALMPPRPALAQEARPSLLAIDTATALEQTVDFNGTYLTGVSVGGQAGVLKAGLSWCGE